MTRAAATRSQPTGCPATRLSSSPVRKTENLTCDLLVTYYPGVTTTTSCSRRSPTPPAGILLDRLFERDGRTLTELESELEMTRFGVMKHLRVLEEAGLVVTRREGREKLHYLNPVPIRLIHDRWIDKYRERQVRRSRTSSRAGGNCMTTMTEQATQVYSVFIRATPEQVWDAITKPEFTTRYFYGTKIDSTFEPGAPLPERRRRRRRELVDGEVLESRPAADARAHVAGPLRPRDPRASRTAA